MSREMHWSRWGDPAMAAPLSEQARGLVEVFLGTRATSMSCLALHTLREIH